MKSFHENHIRYTKNYGWDLRLLNIESKNKYLEPIEKYKKFIKHPVWNQISDSSKLDLEWIFLINHYGGVYMDYTVILTESLDWINSLKDYPSVENDYGEEPDFFICYARQTLKEKYFNSVLNKTFMVKPIQQNDFFAAKQNTLINN